jgi:hypothetical protein
MQISRTLLALSASFLAFTSGASAAITVTFTEGAEGTPDPIPVVTGSQFVAQGGLFSTVALPGFFAVAPAAPFSFTYNLLEPAGSSNESPNLGVAGVSDQITFSTLLTSTGAVDTALLITFTSDPLNFARTSYGATDETGNLQTIPLPPNMPAGVSALTVMAQSDLDPAVPEPSTWTMLLLGFGAIGCVVRRKKRPVPASRPQGLLS